MPTTHDYEYLLQIDKDAMKKLDIMWGCGGGPRANGRQEKKTVAIEDSNSKALVATDNNEDIDWTKEFDAEPTTFAMMALTEVEKDDWSMEFGIAEQCPFGQDGLGGFCWSNKDDDTPVSLLNGYKTHRFTKQSKQCGQESRTKRHGNKGSKSLHLFDTIPEEDLKDYAIIDSGCSGSMTGDKDKLSDFKEFKGGYSSLMEMILKMKNLQEKDQSRHHA
ncbi:hypothetical protein Tco_0675863 [Tanacetum coccineum]